MGDLTARFASLSINNNGTRGDHFKKIRDLGSGAFGRVDLSIVQVKKNYAKCGEQVAIKRFQELSDSEMAKKEARILQKLVHQYIVRYLDIFKNSKGQLCLVMEYCDRGTLEDLFSSWQEYNIWRLVSQFSSVLAYLHGQHPPILHNDLKPANILCKTGTSGKISIKIADFGVCNVLGQTPSAMYYHAAPDGGTVCYLAPEVLRESGHVETSADMWSLGAVLTYIANDRKHLFRTEMDVFRWRGVRSPVKREFQYPGFHDLVRSLLSVDKYKRPSAEEVLRDQRQHRERIEGWRD